MLAPFFTNLLTWCVVMLFAGWALDLVNGWRASARHAASDKNGSASGNAIQFKPHVPVCVGWESRLIRGVTKQRTNA
jgi:hypothetical protein